MDVIGDKTRRTNLLPKCHEDNPFDAQKLAKGSAPTQIILDDMVESDEPSKSKEDRYVDHHSDVKLGILGIPSRLMKRITDDDNNGRDGPQEHKLQSEELALV